MNGIINDIVNDKRPFPFHEQSWSRTALLKIEFFVLNFILSDLLTLYSIVCSRSSVNECNVSAEEEGVGP